MTRLGHQPARCGGTLLEVLVSLVILALLMQMVVQVAAETRTAAHLATHEQEGLEAAMRWRSARAAGKEWAAGTEGAFEHDEALRWRLVMMNAVALDGSIRPDERWRVLEILRADDAVFMWRVTLRLMDEPIPMTNVQD